MSTLWPDQRTPDLILKCCLQCVLQIIVGRHRLFKHWAIDRSVHIVLPRPGLDVELAGTVSRVSQSVHLIRNSGFQPSQSTSLSRHSDDCISFFSVNTPFRASKHRQDRKLNAEMRILKISTRPLWIWGNCHVNISNPPLSPAFPDQQYDEAGISIFGRENLE
jgi:hypothetical protein